MKASFANWVEKRKGHRSRLIDFLATADWKTRCSMGLMGLGQLFHRQFLKGGIYLAIEAAFVYFMVAYGGRDLVGLVTLGTVKADPWLGTPGDNSVTMMLKGLLSVFAVVFFLALYVGNVKGCYRTSLNEARGIAPNSFADDLANLAGADFPKIALFVPILGVVVFSLVPIVMMILIAFTNYGGSVVPPELVSWIGLGNFETIFSLGNVGPTFGKILGWNLLWAFSSTFLNYFLGIGLALLINKKCVKLKGLFRVFPVLAYAIPGFITLIGFRFMFSLGGPINYYLSNGGANQAAIVDFLGLDSKWSARLIGLLVNAWLSIPTTMLLATGLLSNINGDLYEAASIDGAGKTKQFFDITLPYIIFATTPTLISQFIGNFNNFGIFYFLRGGLYSDGYFLSSDTDLLINWLYNLSISNNYYSIGAAISLIIFLLTSTFSLIVYVRSNAYKKEDTYR
ncbi:MAG: sugar ABC transporter permease [Bacilli bacterium]|jgi:arabinogalactan oligomer/maltooligosaccharide transport system permease protein|nr:sugar ABC transporter permease [Bacilli bacterium]